MAVCLTGGKFASSALAHAGKFVAKNLVKKVAASCVPVIGWAWLAYDTYKTYSTFADC